MDTKPFIEWELREELQTALAQLGFETPTPVQQGAFPLVIAGRDLLVQSRTGTGKTLAFGLPLLQRLEGGRGKVDALVVLPTRELALQVAGVLARLTRPLGVEVATLYGGGSYGEQLQALRRGAQIVVGTPGRLVDHIDRGSLDLSSARAVVLDEADEMLDMGFADELDRIFKALPAERQTLLFSATMAPEMRKLAEKTTRNPHNLAISSGLTAAPTIEHVCYEVFPDAKVDALVNVMHVESPELAIVFCHTKLETEKLAERLDAEGFKSAFLNGDLPQAQRTRTLNMFRRRQITVLVATDVAARGIDVKGITHVFNMGVPQNDESYIHRVGRTGRAGASGQAVTFVALRDSARFRRMLHTAGLQVTLKPVPQVADVRTRLRERYHEAIVASMKAELPLERPLRGLADELLGYMEPAELVLALLERDDRARATLEAGIEVAVPKPRSAKPTATKSAGATAAPATKRAASTDTKAKARPMREATPENADGAIDGERQRRKLSEYHEPGMSRVWLNQGKAHKMAAGRLVQLVCSATGLRGEAIGAIAVHSHYCFFDVREGEATRVVEALCGLSFSGKKLKANLVD